MTKYEFDKEMNRVNLRYEETRTSMQREIDAISLEKKSIGNANSGVQKPYSSD